MRSGPSAAAMDPLMTKQKCLQLLPRLGQGPSGGGACPHQIAHRFVGGIENKHGRQLAGPMQRRQGRGVTAVRLHPVARPPRNQSRRHHHAVAAEVGELPVQAVTARAGLVTHPELLAAPPQAFDQPADRLGPILHASQVPHLAIATACRYRHCDRRLVDIQANERDRLHQARLLCLRPCGGQSGATLDMGIR
jgi:hypothetical protein